jgi:RND family efflux transporter MFP subunit
VDDLSSDLASLKIDRDPPRAQASILPRLLGWLLALGALAGLGAWLYPKLEAQFFKAEVKTSTIAEVSPSVALTSLTATGYVIAEKRSKVGANVPGRIAKLHVREGSVVKEGDLLVELDAADQKSNVAAAHARVLASDAKVASERASLRELHVQLERQRMLLTQNAAARSVVEDLEAKIGTAEAQIQAAQAESRASEAQVQLARVTLGRMTVSAPLAGTVLDKPLDVGETVNAQTALMEIADLGSLVVEIDVPEARLSLIKPGGPAEIALDAFAGKRLRGKVREIGKRVNRSKATVPVKVEFTDDTSEVLPDMSARVSFLTEALDEKALAKQSKLVVPAQAVTSRNGQRAVFVVEGGAVRLENVTLGPKSGDGYELNEGPPVGARVVMNPPATLQAGQRVKERTE